MLNYSKFESNQEEEIEKMFIQNIQHKKRSELIQQHIINNKYIKLECDYFGMDSYYYDKNKKIMYKVCDICGWSGDITPIFEISTDEHILKLNSLL